MSETKHESIMNVPPAPVQRMHPLVDRGLIALGPTPDPTALGQLLDLQQKWEAAEAKKSFTRAMTALKRELPAVISKDKKVEFQSKSGLVTYRHTTLAAAMDAVTPELTSHGFSLSWKTTTTVDRSTVVMVTVTCVLTHEDGHSDDNSLSSPPDMSGSKSPAQGVCSTVTLLERHTALALLGIATKDMSDPTPDGSEPGNKSAAGGANVDANRNLRAVGQLGRFGKTCEDAETFLGRKVAEWTDADLKNLEQWCKRPQKKAEEPPEPGSNG